MDLLNLEQGVSCYQLPSFQHALITNTIYKMEVQSDVFEPTTPGLSYSNASYWKNEDSGYHTSFTSSSIECAQVSNENIDPSVIQGQIRIAEIPSDFGSSPASNFHLTRKYRRTPINIRSRIENIPESPIARRGVKRSYQSEDDISYSSTSTPTTKIAGGIQKLRVTDNNTPSHTSLTVSSVHSGYSYSATSDLFHLNEYVPNLSYPTTPVKKICQTSCKLSPSKRSAKKINFTIHSLSCETRGVLKHRPHSKVVRTIQFRPDQKIDILRMLYKVEGAIPPVTKILSYLSNEDIQTFCLVSPLWLDIWNDLGTSKKKQYKNFLKEIKDNQENRTDLARRSSNTNQIRSVKEVHNVLNAHVVISSPKSPPGTPRTNKFKKFTKAASLDSRVQLSCVRCMQPSKVTEEPTGEEWAECTNVTCAYQYCRFCKCNRHPGKTCFKYDLEVPSPSKRKKNTAGVCTKKSRRNLHRLMN